MEYVPGVCLVFSYCLWSEFVLSGQYFVSSSLRVLSFPYAHSLHLCLCSEHITRHFQVACFSSCDGYMSVVCEMLVGSWLSITKDIVMYGFVGIGCTSLLQCQSWLIFFPPWHDKMSISLWWSNMIVAAELVRPSLCRFAVHGPWSVWKQFSIDCVQWIMLKAGCQIIALVG